MKKRIVSLFLAVMMFCSVFAVANGVIATSVTQALAAVDDNAETTENEGAWIGAWGAGMTDISFVDYPNLYVSVRNTAARVVITPTASGNQIRLRISNVYGKNPLIISGIRIHESNGGSKVKLGTGKTVLYNDSYKIIVPAGKEIVTDPIKMKVTAQKDIVVTMYVASELQDITTASLSGARTYLALNQDVPDALEDLFTESGNFLPFPLSSSLVSNVVPALASLPEINVVPLLSGVDVYNTEEDPYSVVIIGDSTVTNNMPLYISRAIAAEECTNVGVIGKGIIGNSLLSDGQGKAGNIYGPALLNRMKVDVLQQSGVRYAVIKIGANDITHPESASIKDYYGGPYEQPSAQDLIDGFEQFIKRCHNYGIKVIGCTITQWKGTTRNYFGTDEQPEYEWKEEDWQIAQDVNEWMLSTKSLDGVVDYAAMSGSSSDPAKFRSDYTSDFIHPNDKAQQAWASEFPLDTIGISTVPQAIVIAPDKVTIAVGKSYELEAKITPASAENASVTWTSSKPSVVSVTQDGTITAHQNGTATITCKTYNGKTAKCAVTVKTTTTGVTLSDTSLTLYVTQTKKLTATVKPSAAEDKSVVWTSTDESVATVSSKGMVTAVGKGIAVIRCTTKDTGKSAACVVEVKKSVRVTGVTLNKTSKTIYKGYTYQLKPTVSPSNASNTKITWKSDDTDVATVSSSGLVTAVGNGKAKIYAITQDGSYTAVCKVTVKTKATGVKLNKTAQTVYIGKTYNFSATVSPSSATNKNVTWKSSNKSVATVNSKGVVTGKSAGTCTITCTTEDGGYKATCKVTVEKFVAVKSVSVNKTKVKLNGGDTYQLKATVSPSNASIKTVKWTSSNTKVAKVSSSGKITALKKGTATITCTTTSGSKIATCKVTVTSTPVTGVKLNKKTLTLNVGSKYTLVETVLPSDASYTAVTWKSSNTKVAKVSSSGKVTAVGKGTCTITCTTEDGYYTAKCTVTVTEGTEDPNDFVTVKLDKGTLSLRKGEKYTLKATISPANMSDIGVTWTSTNPNVATVNSKGVVTAVGSGTCIIKCTTKNGSWTANCQVTVT